MSKTLLQVNASADIPVKTYLESSPAWSITEGPADWMLKLWQSKKACALELRYTPANIRIHSAKIDTLDRPQSVHWTALLRRFALTRPVSAVSLMVRSRDVIQLNRGLADYVEPDMRCYVVRKNQKIAEVCVVGVQENDSIARITNWGRGIKPEDTVIGLWVP